MRLIIMQLSPVSCCFFSFNRQNYTYVYINLYIIQQKIGRQKILDGMAVDIPKFNLFLILHSYNSDLLMMFHIIKWMMIYLYI